ncbi:MAG: glycine cleavage system protein GcvH [Candidatus Omnitrophota bacterium]|nr:MAG: glycine cleavage system protein GcvH [Candidatus Omnitrophota bacterium]
MADVKFAQSHEWVRVEGECAVVGITEYAQKQLGDIVFVELPKVGDKLKQSFQFGVVESTKAASELYAPLSGQVNEVNTDLVHNPQWVNEEPFGKGWMIKVKIEDKDELGRLLDEESYKALVQKEGH